MIGILVFLPGFYHLHMHRWLCLQRLLGLLLQ